LTSVISQFKVVIYVRVPVVGLCQAWAPDIAVI